MKDSAPFVTIERSVSKPTFLPRENSTIPRSNYALAMRDDFEDTPNLVAHYQAQHY